jgi:hypothetical protein
MDTARCVECHKDIRVDLAFCPGCGADNRAPEHRCKVAPHLHDFTQGSFCILCGESYVAEGKKPPAHGYVFRNFSGLGMAVFCVIGLGYFIFPGYYDRPTLSIPVGIGIAIITIAVGFAIQSRVLIDLDKKEVRVVAGMWPFLHVRRHSFSEVRAIQVGIRTSYGQYNNYTYYTLSLLMMGDDASLDEYRGSGSAFAKAQDLATAINCPIEDDTGMQMTGFY